jgi:hypothetical protein
MSVVEEKVLNSEFGEIHLKISGFEKTGSYGEITARLIDKDTTTTIQGYEKREAAKKAIKRLLERENMA